MSRAAARLAVVLLGALALLWVGGPASAHVGGGTAGSDFGARVVSVTPEVLGEYLDRFDADLPTQFVGLTGPQDVIDQAQLSAGVPLAEDAGRLHSSLLLLYGADDEAHVAFDAGNTSRDIAGDLETVAGA